MDLGKQNGESDGIELVREGRKWTWAELYGRWSSIILD